MLTVYWQHFHIIQRNASKWVEPKKLQHLDAIAFYSILRRKILLPVTEGIEQEDIRLSKYGRYRKTITCTMVIYLES